MALRQKDVRLGDLDFKLQTHPGLHSQDTMQRLLRFALPPLLRGVGGALGKDVDFQALGDAAQLLFIQLPPAEFTSLRSALFRGIQVKGTKGWIPLDDETCDHVFSGCAELAYQLMWESIRFNYSGFGSTLRAKLGPALEGFASSFRAKLQGAGSATDSSEKDGQQQENSQL